MPADARQTEIAGPQKLRRRRRGPQLLRFETRPRAPDPNAVAGAASGINRAHIGRVDMARDLRFRAARALAGAGIALAVLAAAVGVSAPLVIRGERFGRLVESLLPATRGRVQVGGGRWSWQTVIAFIRERPAPLTLDDVRVTDPEGTRVLRARRISGRVEVLRAAGRVVIRDLRVEDADWTFARMKAEDGIGFLAALAPRDDTAPSREGAARAPQFSIADARLEGLTATFDFPDWGLFLRNVRAAASLAVGSSASAPVTFEVRGADVSAGGRLRVLGGPDALTLAFTRARLDRIASTPEAPDAIRLEASTIALGRSTLALAGGFQGVYGLSPASRAPGLGFDAWLDDAADVVDELARGIGIASPPSLGPRAKVTLRLDGPFAELRAKAALVSGALGRLDADATLEGRGIVGGLTFTGFRPAPLLPLPLLPFASGTLDGRIRGRLELDRSASLDELSLLLTRPKVMGAPRYVRVRVGPRRAPGPRGPAGWAVDVSGIRYAAGVIRLPRVAFKLLGGRLTAKGRVLVRDPRHTDWLPSPILDLAVKARGVSIESLLGEGFVAGGTAFQAEVRGPLRNLAVGLAVSAPNGLAVLGQRFDLPRRIALRLVDDVVLFDGVRLGGPEGSTFVASGRVAMSGRLGFGIVVRDFPFNRLPGLAQTGLPIAGRVSGEIHLAGGPTLPAVSGRLALDPVTFQGRPVGGGDLVITPGPRGAIRAQGRLIEGIEVDGVLEPEPSGLGGRATLELHKLRLDPFFPTLPGGITAISLLSGRVVAAIAPGRPAQAEGWLSELTLVVSPPHGGRKADPIELHADNVIHLAASSGDGPLTIGPARFRGNVGAFELSGESRGDELRASLRGRVDLGPFEPLTAPWFEHIAGAIDVDLTAARLGPSADLDVAGEISIASPLVFRPSAIPLEARAPSGRIRFGHDNLGHETIETTSFPIGVRAERLASDAIRNLAADVRIDARVTGPPATPSARVSMLVDRLVAQIPSLGPEPIESAGGEIKAESRGPELQIVGVDLPIRGRARGVSAAGTRIDDATFAVRLQGDPRRRMSLAGDLEVKAARVGARAHEASEAARPAAGWAARKEVENTRLDLRIRSHGGAVVVEVPRLPDLRVDLDIRVTGTPNQPVVTGEPRGANIYSRLVLALRRLLR